MAGSGAREITRRMIFLLLGLALATGCFARQLVTYTIHHADPRQIQAVVQQYLSPDSSASVYQNTLIVNGTAEELAKTRALLAQLDSAGRQLLISVKTAGDAAEQQRQVNVSGSVRGGSAVETTTRTTVTVKAYNASGSSSGRQGVRATEGQPALVTYGASAPVNSYRSTADGRIVSGQEYVDAMTGFYATAWLDGDHVRVRIDQRREQLNGQVIQGQQLQTEVSGRLGQWLPIGMLQDSSRQRVVGLSGYDGRSSSGDDAIYLKVELLD